MHRYRHLSFGLLWIGLNGFSCIFNIQDEYLVHVQRVQRIMCDVEAPQPTNTTLCDSNNLPNNDNSHRTGVSEEKMQTIQSAEPTNKYIYNSKELWLTDWDTKVEK